jgi:hypothetical protein
MLTQHYKTMTGMQSDTWLAGKFYPKLNAYLQLANGDMLYICSSCQYKTQRRFKQCLLEEKSFAEGSKLIIEKGE